MNDIPNYNDYLGQNEDWGKFNQIVSDNTGKHYKDLWLKNLSKNKPLVEKYGWAAEHLQDACIGKTVVMLGASPAIRNQIETLRDLQYDPDFIFIGITSGLKWLFENGIKPRYCMIADADPKMLRFWENMDMSKTQGITLISNVLTAPEMLEKWEGDIKFLGIYTAIKKMDKKYKKLYPNVNGCGLLFPALCSQYNTGVAFAFLVMGCKIIIFVGNELSFPSPESHYYVDNREDYKDKWSRKPHPDIYGNIVYTNYMFMALKLSIEDFLGKISGNGWFLNATGAGIFGVNKRYGNLSWIKQMKLKTAIAQARHIMIYGEPIYENSLIFKPTLKESLLYARA